MAGKASIVFAHGLWGGTVSCFNKLISWKRNGRCWVRTNVG